MGSVAMRGMSRGFVVLAVSLMALLVGSAFALARSGGPKPRVSAICVGAEAGGPSAARCSGSDILRRPTLIEGQRISPRRHHRRPGKAPAITLPVGEVPGSPQPPSQGTPVSSGPGAPPVVEPTQPVDTVPPNTSIVKGPASTTTATTAKFTVAANEAGSTFDCKLDDETWAPCPLSVTYDSLDLGSHQFAARATDAAGNTDTTPASKSWTVTEPPVEEPPVEEPPVEEPPVEEPPVEEPPVEEPPVEEPPVEEPPVEEPPVEEPPVEEPPVEEPPVEEPPVEEPPVEEPPVEEPPVEEPPVEEPPVESEGCDQNVSSVSAAQSALSSASPGQAVCLADGVYGNLTLSSSKAAPGVTLRAANPGNATIGDVDVSGSGYTISRFVIDGGVTMAPNTDRTVVDHNQILSGSHYGVFVCTATPPDQCDDTKIVGNLFDGAMNEDQIRANVYHDGDGDGVGLLVEGNEFRGNTERGGHNDVFQSVWVGDHLVFNKNYLHDFGGQGFFVKDQDTAINGFIANNNLIVDQDRPCEPASLCTGYQLSPWQIYGPISGGEMRNNTVGWGTDGGGAVLTGKYTNIDFSNNVFNRLALTDGGGSAPTLTGSNNTYCDNSSWSVPPGTTKDCAPAFLNPAAADYRLASGRGVTWVPSEQHYGP
jgi:hypothetical protein